MEDNNPILKNGQVDLYIIPKGVAGTETLSLSIPGLKEEKIKIRLHPGPLSKIEIKRYRSCLNKRRMTDYTDRSARKYDRKRTVHFT